MPTYSETGPLDVIFIDSGKLSNPKNLAAAIELTRPALLIVLDNVVHNSEVTNTASDDFWIRGVHAVTDDIVAHPGLDPTAVQAFWAKG